MLFRNRINLILSLLLAIYIISACNKDNNDEPELPPDEYIYFSSNGVQDSVTACCYPVTGFTYKDSAATNSNPISIYIFGQGNNGNLSFGFSRVNIAAGSVQTLLYYGAGGPAGTGGYSLNPTSTGVRITEYGSVGQYIKGNFDCSFKSTFTQNFYNVTCNFKILRR